MSSSPEIPIWALNDAVRLLGVLAAQQFQQATLALQVESLAKALAETRANALEEAAKVCDTNAGIASFRSRRDNPERGHREMDFALDAFEMSARKIRALKTKNPISPPVDTSRS